MSNLGVGISTVCCKMPLVVIHYIAFILPLAMSMVSVVSSGKKLPPVHWTSSNPMFVISNTDHIINVNVGDSIDIICPQYAVGSNPREWEYYVLYRVEQEEYDRCTIFDPRLATFLLNCSNPTIDPPDIYTLLIKDFQSIPGNPDFFKGDDYYFVSTSGGHRREMPNQYLGACHDEHMKMTIKVCCISDKKNTTNPGTPQPVTDIPPRTHPSTTSRRPKTKPPTTRKTTMPDRTTQKIYYPKTDEEKNPTKNLIDDKVIHANGPKNVGLIIDTGNSGIVQSYSLMLVTVTVTLSSLLWCR